MPYVDGFVLPLPKRNLKTYRRLATKAGKVTSFPRSVRLKSGETVLFAWIVFKSRAHRDQVNAKVIADPRLAGMMDAKLMPFDAKRMIYGGFKSLVRVPHT